MASHLVFFPFPLENYEFAGVYLPATLTRAEYERLIKMLEAIYGQVLEDKQL